MLKRFCDFLRVLKLSTKLVSLKTEVRDGLEVVAVCSLSCDDFSFGFEWTATKVAKLSLNVVEVSIESLCHFFPNWNLN